ncbi:Protein NEP-17 a, partial [Aphelenchoides avenae]
MDMLQYASGRAYVDVALPTDASRKNMRDKTGRMLAEVLVAFQSMIDQLDWMDENSKKEAYAKIANIAKNIGYNDFIVDDAQLEDHYKSLDFSQATTYIEYLDALNKFLTREQLVHLARTKAQGTDRTNFAGSSPAT